MPDVFPISIKGVVVSNGRVLLLKNERDEWELPGGRIESGETPIDCVAREIAEETRWSVTPGPILDSWMYHIAAARMDVFIVTYGCYPADNPTPNLSRVHKKVGLFPEAEVPGLNMPDGYKRSIAGWFEWLRLAAEVH